MTIDPLFTLLGATPDVLPLIREYITLWYVAMMVVVTPMVGNHCIRATGDMKTPALIMLFAVTLNAVLDPILIFGLGDFAGLGIAGASLATVISRAFTLVASLLVLHYREHMLTFVRPSLADVWESWRQILYIGIPAAGTQMLIPLSLGVITGMVAVYGPAAVAAFGVASRIETFGLAIVQALATTLTPFVGQNWGAGEGWTGAARRQSQPAVCGGLGDGTVFAVGRVTRTHRRDLHRQSGGHRHLIKLPHHRAPQLWFAGRAAGRQCHLERAQPPVAINGVDGAAHGRVVCAAGDPGSGMV